MSAGRSLLTGLLPGAILGADSESLTACRVALLGAHRQEGCSPSTLVGAIGVTQRLFRFVVAILVWAVACSGAATKPTPGGRADTFTNRRTGETLKGEFLGIVEKDGQRQVYLKSEDGQRRFLPASDWEVHRAPKRPVVAYIQIEVPIDCEDVADVVARALTVALRRRPEAVVFEIDTPGGVVAHAQRICRAIEETGGARSVAFVKTGNARGAFSAGALVAMACEAIYMAEGSSIGAATPYVRTKDGPRFSEKMTSAFSASFRALAERRSRPPAVAAAMVDPDVDLREVTYKGKRQFVPGDRAAELAQAGASLGRWITRKGKLLTLTAREARDLGIAAGVVKNRDDLQKALGIPDHEAMDLRTTRTLGPWLAVLGERDRAARSDPRSFKYPMKLVYPDVLVDGEWRPGPNPREQFADGGRLWRERTSLCGRHVDRCLSLCQAYMKKARSSPGVWVDEARVTATMRELKQWRKRLPDEQLRFW